MKKLITSLLVWRHYEHLFLFSVLKLHVTSSRFAYICSIFITLPTHFQHARTEAHIHKHTCIISTQEEWRQPDTVAWLREAGKRLLLETRALHTHKNGAKMSGKTRYSRIESKGFEHIELPTKLLDYFLRSNKSNINQLKKDRGNDHFCRFQNFKKNWINFGKSNTWSQQKLPAFKNVWYRI